MRSAGVQRGFQWTVVMASMRVLRWEAFDRTTGGSIPLWPGWVHEFVRQAGLLDAFRRAANSLDAGLGDAFVAEANQPVVHPLSADRRTRLENITGRLMGIWEKMPSALAGFADPETKRALSVWAAHPGARAVETIVVQVEEFVHGVGSAPEAIQNFVAGARAGSVRDRLGGAFWSQLQQASESTCTALAQSR